MKIFKIKGLGKWFGHFWFLNHSLKWFLVVPPKDAFTLKHQRKVWEKLYYQICPMNHTLHISDEWNILLLDLSYNSKFKTSKGTNPINT
jgi:hypothetical protein